MIPPRSETVFLVNVSDRFTTERKSSLKNKIETTVIFEPDELGSNGVYFARVLNSVKGTDFKNKSVQLPVKVINVSQNEFSLSKNKTVGNIYCIEDDNEEVHDKEETKLERVNVMTPRPSDKLTLFGEESVE